MSNNSIEIDMYKAITDAANHIERYPRLFSFSSVIVPERNPGPDTTGCAIGWVAHFANQQHSRKRSFFGTYSIWDDMAGEITSLRLFGVGEADFFRRLRKYERVFSEAPHVCAKALRAYAEEYHGPAPAPQPIPRKGIPDLVRDIFQVPSHV